jgi:phospholipase C
MQLNKLIVQPSALGVSILLLLTTNGVYSEAAAAPADGLCNRVNHVVVLMQENRSFDHYFGALPYAPSTPYRLCTGTKKDEDNHLCIDGLSGCAPDPHGDLKCTNSNIDTNNHLVYAFHEKKLCVEAPEQGWADSHYEANFDHPNETFQSSPNDGFVRQNEKKGHFEDTMGFFTWTDLPFYYDLATTFAIDDHYFSSLMGPTGPNRQYLDSATSFGHVAEGASPPHSRTIAGLLNSYNPSVKLHTYPSLPDFVRDATSGSLPDISFGGFFSTADSEHPPCDIRQGEYSMWQAVSAVRNGPNWKDTIIFITYDEHGGFYDHIAPAHAPNPDMDSPGHCEYGACNDTKPTDQEGDSRDVPLICPKFDPAKPYPSDCPNFDQLGFRVPFIAISPFSKQHYVSHVPGDHTSILALIEKRFLGCGTNDPKPKGMTSRDQGANTLEDMFDFSSNPPPSLDAKITSAPTPTPEDSGCPPADKACVPPPRTLP